MPLTGLEVARLWRPPWGLFRVLLAIGCLAGLLRGEAAAAASFTVSLDRDTISLGESATLSLNFDGGPPDNTPALPRIPNLSFGTLGQSTQFSNINGVQSSSQAYNYAVTPAQAGVYAIPAISVKVGGQLLTSRPAKLTVLKAGTPTINPNSAFLRLVVPKNEVFLGEILPVEIQLFVRLKAQLSEMPHFKEEGFTLGKMLEPAQTSTIVDGQRFTVATFKTYVVPVKAGQLALGPAVMAVNMPRPNSRTTIFGELLDWQSVTLESEPQTLQVLPLPRENVPAGFNGAVGSFSLNVDVSPTNIVVGDPITVKVRISGRGPLDAVTLPEQNGWQQFKLYPPTSEFQPADPSGASGTKTFALTAVPTSMDIKEMPPFVFSFFDPDQKTYRTLAQPAVPLIVRPSAASLPPVLASATTSSENQTANQDLLHIKPRLGALGQIRLPLVQQPLFLALQAIPALVWLSLLLNRRHVERLVRNPRLRRQRQVEQAVRAALRELRQAVKENQPEAFFATLFRLLQEQLGACLDLPASAITEAVVEEHLRPLSLPEPTLASVRELFQICNQTRYGRHSTTGELASLIPKVESTVLELKKIKA